MGLNKKSRNKPEYIWKFAITSHWDKDGPFHTWCWDNWVAIWKKMKSDVSFVSYIRINLKWIKDLKM